MPARKNEDGVASAFRQVQDQARSLLSNLRKEIRTKEAELLRLKDEEMNLSRLTGSAPAKGHGAGAAPRRRGAGRGRIDWRVILEQLPKQFKAAQIREIRGLKDKRPSEIFAAITRWIDAGIVKRKDRGLYERA
jgi:hypothetical protein